MQLPPISLSSGPAISGSSPNESGAAFTGDFTVNRGGRWQDRIALAVPALVAGGALWLLLKKR